MTIQTPYQYKVFSRRMGNIYELHRHEREIATFYSAHFQDSLPEKQLAAVSSSIEKEWVGAVVSFDGLSPVGFMSFHQKKDNLAMFQVGFAFVEKAYRHKKIWEKMSGLVEEEVRYMGGKQLNREIDVENERLVNHLLREGYYLFSGSNETDYHPMAKRL